MRNALAIAVAAAGLLLAGSVQAQSLGELAAKERAKREAEQKKKPVKSFTDEDLGSGAGSNTSIMSEPEATSETPAAATDAQGTAGAATKPENQRTEDQLRAERLTEWRGKLDAARKNEANLRVNIDQVQLDINDMSGGVYSARRAEMLKVLEEQKKKLADTQKQIADLEDEGRRNAYR